MTHILMIGFSAVFLRGIDGKVPPASITVLEEPDIIRGGDLARKAEALGCVAALVPATYHQGGDHVAVAEDLHARVPVTAVVPGLEYGVVAAAAIAERLGLPGASPRAAATLRDKSALREVTAAAGVRNPRWREIRSAADIVEFAGAGPVVVKPADRQGSVGVQLLDAVDPDIARQAWQAVVGADEPGKIPDRPMRWRYLAEERLTGAEFSAEALVSGGSVVFLNITEKFVIPGRHPVEAGHLLPAALGDDEQAEFDKGMRMLVAATGFDTGILHAEWMRTEQGLTLIECAGRCPGDRITDLIDQAYGTSLRNCLIDLLSGRPAQLPGPAGETVTIQFLAAEPGVVEDVHGVEEARALPGVGAVHVSAGPGDTARAWSSSWDRSGFVVASGAGRAEALGRAEAARAAIRIETR
ncbi:ATP-grasp domain-containing protein [Streptomyces sp. NPDC046727]|uniref:ATP-grasp domain-containing protein n=1 Tax=Streptomyces sp. NPDC046727 TaxID=3155373 RepID=UPI0033E48E45